jgi:hypothetical protein
MIALLTKKKPLPEGKSAGRAIPADCDRPIPRGPEAKPPHRQADSRFPGSRLTAQGGLPGLAAGGVIRLLLPAYSDEIARAFHPFPFYPPAFAGGTAAWTIFPCSAASAALFNILSQGHFSVNCDMAVSIEF